MLRKNLASLLPYTYLYLSPVVALAHGGIDDGDGPDPDAPVVDGSADRLKAMIVFAVITLLVVLVYLYMRKKN